MVLTGVYPSRYTAKCLKNKNMIIALKCFIRERVKYYCILATMYSKHVHYLEYCSNPHNTLCSNLYDGLLLANPNGKSKKTLGGCAFSRAAPKFWNSLPPKIRELQNIKTFKNRVKTFLFSTTFQ
jgi:hypothetical protein